MKILYSNLNVLDIKCDDRDNTKEQSNCISITVPSETDWLGKMNRKQYEEYYRDFYCLLTCSSMMRNLI